MRLGTSSPNTMVVNVMAETTTAVAVTPAAASGMPICCSHRPRPALNAASPTMPLSMPMEVMPTCTDERNCVGSSSSRSAARAPLSPPSAIAAKRSLRLDARASSDIANTPLSRVSSAISRKSMVSSVTKSFHGTVLYRRHPGLQRRA